MNDEKYDHPLDMFMCVMFGIACVLGIYAIAGMGTIAAVIGTIVGVILLGADVWMFSHAYRCWRGHDDCYHNEETK